MKLALRVALALIAGVVLVLGGFGYFRVKREITLFDSDMRKDHELIGSTLAVPVRDVWFSDGPARAQEVVRLADDDHDGVHIGWVQRGSSASILPIDWQRLDKIQHSVQLLSGPLTALRPAPEGTPFLVTHVPVTGKGQLLGAVELATSFETRDRYVRASILNSIEATLVMSGVSAAVVLVLGLWLIGRPLARLAEMARRVGAEEPGEPLDLRQRDEIGFLASEMNAMCERLAAANEKAAAEAHARQRAQEQLRHADRLITVGRLAAGIAHELGSPLNIVSGRAKMIVRGKIEGSAIVEYARSIADQADRMTSSIQQLLDFSRRREPDKHHVNLTALTTGCAELLRHMAAKKGIQLVVDCAEEIRVHADPGQIDQVTTNLVVNALQASPAGATVRICTGVSDGVGQLAPTERFAFLRIEDQGTGMSDDVRRQVFEPFFTTKPMGQGAGLGLSVAFGIVEEHGGWIDVQSELGRGSVFSVYLPQGKFDEPHPHHR
ncbi:MAG TPA: ATP-binding protein [Polyangiaceae bacterium]|nr:ATP-binding protein [Polyangiaceae bacterium]